MSHHEERFTSFLKKEIAMFLERSLERPSATLLSVTDAVMNTAGESADIYVSIFPEKASATVFPVLQRAERETRAYLAAIMKRRKIPQIRFVLDTKQGDRIQLEKLLENVKDK